MPNGTWLHTRKKSAFRDEYCLAVFFPPPPMAFAIVPKHNTNEKSNEKSKL